MNEAEKKINKVYISLGSNIEPEKNIHQAIKTLSKVFGGIQLKSSVWKTPAVGSNGPDFLNSIILINTELSLDDLRNNQLRPIETEMGRVRTTDKNAPRTIDLDILIFNNALLETELWEQAHLAVPLSEIYPKFKNPSNKQTIAQVAEELRGKTTITRIVY